MVKQSSYQYVWQSVSRAEQPGDEHTEIREPYILSQQPEEEKFYACELPRLKCTGGGWGGWRYALCNLGYFFPFLTPLCLSSITAFLTSSLREKYKYRHLKSCRLYEKSHRLSYWNEVQQQLLHPLKDSMQNWLFHIRGPCSLRSHRAGMLDSRTTTKATIYQL